MEKKKMRELDYRCITFMIVMLVMCGILVAKLFNLQITRYDEYQSKVIDNIQQETTVAAERGQIYDRNMVALATNVTTYRLFVSPSDIIKEGSSKFEEKSGMKADEIEDGKKMCADEQIALVAEKLAEAAGLDKDSIISQINKYSTRKDITIEKNVDVDTAEAIRKIIEENGFVTQVYLEATTKRYYPYGSLAASVIGLTGTDGGLIGLELKYDEYLTGTPGRYISNKNAQSQSLPSEYNMYTEPEDGLNLVSTIDITIQNILEEQLKLTYTESQAAERVTGIVMNPSNGEIYAMATYPNFDLNDPYTLTENFADLYSSWKYDAQEEDGKTEEEAKNDYFWTLVYKMWNNKAVNDLYEPGSTFKIITTAMALDEKVVSFNDQFTCTGRLTVAGKSISCHKAGGHGTEIFSKQLQASCNPTIMQVAARVGSKNFYKYFEAFGYTSKTGIDLPGEASGLYVKESGLNAVELACYSFGQTFKTTPIQQITAICSVANGGYLVTPHVVSAMTDKDGKIVKSFDSGTKRQVISSEVSKSIMEVLREGVSNGQGVANAYIAGYRVAAKTGTSQKRDDADENARVGSCIAVAPADDPQICVLIIVDEPQIKNKYGSNVAAPYVASVVEKTLTYLGTERVYSEDEMTRIAVKVGKYNGLTVDEAKQKIEKSKLSYEIVGNGKTIVGQSPASGEYVTNISGKIILYTENNLKHETVSVPNVVGQSASVAIKQLNSLGFNVYIDGAANYSSGTGATVIAQGTAAGENAEYGEVIKITCRYLDESDGDSGFGG